MQSRHSKFMTSYQQDMTDLEEKAEELSVSFGYQCNDIQTKPSNLSHEVKVSAEIKFKNPNISHRSSSFSCLAGAALGANATLANTNICNGLFGEEILPGLDSPKSFRRLPSSPSLTKLDFSYSSSQSSSIFSTSGGSLSAQFDILDNDKGILSSTSTPTRIETSSFLNASDVQMAGGAAGEDRVQAVCSEENGCLFCGIYDGFNGRDAADFLAGTLYESIGFYLNLLEWQWKQKEDCNMLSENKANLPPPLLHKIGDGSSFLSSCKSFGEGVSKCLQLALAQAESDFMYMVEQEMDNRPDLVTVGSCVLAVLLHGQNLYTLNLGDSRAIMATFIPSGNSCNLLKAFQLTDTHTVDEESERTRILNEHLDDPLTIIGDRVKGKLKLTRAFGVGYLKKSKMNDVLMGILRVRNLSSPPYVSTEPSMNVHSLSERDCFVVIGSDGLFDFFTNDETVELVHSFLIDNPTGDPAKYIIGQLMIRAAENAGMSIEQLASIPVGRRRKYHDDVTVIVILLDKNRMSRASIFL